MSTTLKPLLAGLLLLAPAYLAAADRSETIVQAVLAREATADVPSRAALLQGALAASPKLDSVHWAIGQVADGNDWRAFDARVDETAADATLAEYRARRDESELTSARHRELAAWCGKQGLADQERAHLWALLAENANQPDVWRRLGYRNVDGQWLTAAEERELDRLWQQRQRDLKRWLPQVEKLAERLTDTSPSTQADAREQLRHITDLAALPALETTLCTRTPDLALEYIAWAKGLDRVETTLSLARQAIVSPWEITREMAIDALRPRRLAHFAPAVLTVFSTPFEPIGESVVAPNWTRGQVLYAQQFTRELHNHIEVYQIRGFNVPIAVPYLVNLGVRRDRLYSPEGRQRLAVASDLVAAANARASNDLSRDVEDRLQAGRQQADRANQQIAELNARCSRLLSTTSGESVTQSPQEWWSWWYRYSATETSAPKRVVEVQEIEVIPSAPQMRISIDASCLPAGTLVFTELGPKPIETIKVGDRVLAKDIDSGELAYRPVLRTTVRSPQPLVKLGLRSETLLATRGHHFWVSGKGWRMARELQPGDRLHGVAGTVAVTDIATGDVAAVYNLVVDRANTYFVGDSMILSHDVTSPAPTNVKVPGLR